MSAFAATAKKNPKSYRSNFSNYGKAGGVPTTLQKTGRRRDQRGSSMLQKGKENQDDINPYSTTAKNKNASKMLFSGKMHGSSSLVRPKRIVYPAGADTELAPVNHEAAKQKLETLFNHRGVRRRDPLQLLTKPKKKLNLLKKIPNEEKSNVKSKKKGQDTVIIQKSDLKLNRTGMNQMKNCSDTSLTGMTQGRVTTAQTHSTASRAPTRGGRTRQQIIAEFFCSQNWNYLARKALMVRHERRETKVCIMRYRHFKRGMKKFWKVYKAWIERTKKARAEAAQLEKAKLEQAEAEKLASQEKQQQHEVEEIKRNEEEKRLPDEICEVPEVTKCEFAITEDNDILSLNEGVDLSKFKNNESFNYDDYDQKLKEIKEDKKKMKQDIKQRKVPNLDMIQEEEDESISLSPFHAKVGKVLAKVLEKAWVIKQQRREGKKLRGLLKNLPPQCRTSYVKLMQLRAETADLQNNVKQSTLV